MADQQQKNTSTVVVALPVDDDPCQGIGPEQKHATILYFGGPDDHEDPDSLDQSAGLLKQVLQVAAANRQPFTADVTGTAELGAEGAQVWLLDSPELHELFHALPDIDTEVQSLYEDADVTRYPEYKPHVTIGYTGDDSEGSGTGESLSDDDMDDASAVKQIKFDRLALWHGDEQTEFPLGGQQSPEPAMVAAMVRVVRTQEGSKRFGVPIGSEIQTNGKGQVTVMRKGPAPAVKGRRALPPKPDPKRMPTKFVPTVPGQKAKLVFPPAPHPAAGGVSNGLNKQQLTAVTNMGMISKWTTLSAVANQAVIDAEERRSLSPSQKGALRSMIESIFDKIHAQENLPKTSTSTASKTRTAAQKAATQKAQAASSKSTSAAKKSAQKKSQSAASKVSAWCRRLKGAYRALGGNPDDLPSVSGA